MRASSEAVGVKMGEEGRFWFDDTCSPEEMGALRPILAKHERILPPWIDAVHVECKINDPEWPDCVASIGTRLEYRRATLTIFGLWLGQTPEHREHSIIHELVHLFTDAQRVWAKDIVLLLTTDKPDLKAYLREQERKINEATTEDLTLLLRRLGYFGA
jgi:hypothetical protein